MQNCSKCIRNVCVITNKYPNKYEPNVLVFVQQLVWQFANMGIACTVICPMPFNIHLKYIFMNYKENEITDNGKNITILRPKCIGFGQSNYGKLNPAKITTRLFDYSVRRTIKKENIKPDAIYSHFVTPAGITASRLASRIGIPAFMAYGEATTMTIDHVGGPTVVKKELSSLSGIITVSSYSRKLLVDMGIVNLDKTRAFPNGFNPNRFFVESKTKAREEFGFPTDGFIVCFVGSFDNRKGVLRLQQAVDCLEGVLFACAGKGALQPTSHHCVYARAVDNNHLRSFYCACDVFVLPTLQEGCCNAIIEAMACGLPIISSDRPFNNDILDETNSLRIDPTNVEQISATIATLRDDETLRRKLSEGSLRKAKELTLEKRAKDIIVFMERMSGMHGGKVMQNPSEIGAYDQ